MEYPLERFLKSSPTTSLGDLIGQSWDELAVSCTFLPSHEVYLCVSRIIFHPGSALDKVRASFLRGRIFDESWTHQSGYILSWPGAHPITFPNIFDVGMKWKPKGLAYGPEDPRIIVEDVPGAEPVIVFSMLGPTPEWKRAMFVFRPFTNVMTILTVRGTERPRKEKNWSPFFLSDLEQPSTVLYFIWRHAPLTILRCSLQDGMCDIAYEQQVAPELVAQAHNSIAELRGGTQLVPIPRSIGSLPSPGVEQAYLTVSRHHVNPKPYPNCTKPAYRPEIVVLKTNGTHFYFAYISGPIDFGPDMVFSAPELAESCGAGRIIIATSIARWEVSAPAASRGAFDTQRNADVMTLSLTVNDNSVQFVLLSGVYELLQGLPSLSTYFGGRQSIEDGKEDAFGAFEGETAFQKASAAGWTIRTCVEDAAEEYTWQHLGRVDKPWKHEG